jgi:hypothetical protein
MNRPLILSSFASLAAFVLVAGFAEAQVADPQRPDGAPIETGEVPSAPGALPPGPGGVPFDPQRPDAHEPAKPVRRNPNQSPVIELTLTPAAEPVPALKYELLPGPLERKPGNGATNYYRAFLHMQQTLAAVPKEEREKFYQEYDSISDMTLAEMPKQEMEKWVGYYRNALAEAKAAAYREECHFQLREQDFRGMETVNFLLHDFQVARDLGRALRMRARLEISKGKLDDAIETVRQGMQLGRDTTDPEILINGLIGVAIINIMQEELIEIIDQPGSPNLYWALASLPRPLVSIRRGLRFEMDMPERMFPFLKDAETAQRTPEEWQKLMVESLSSAAELDGKPNRMPEWQSRLAATAGLMMVYPESKKRLAEEGFDVEALEKMPAAQVVAIQASRAQKRYYHNAFKWTSLPYSQQGRQAEEAMQAMMTEIGGAGQFTAADPLYLARQLLPAVQQAMIAEMRMQSSLAAIQAIEALRMHAAANAGELPQTLAEVTIVPVPLNPTTDKPFPYEVKDGVATLTIPSPAGYPANFGKKYVIRMEAR